MACDADRLAKAGLTPLPKPLLLAAVLAFVLTVACACGPARAHTPTACENADDCLEQALLARAEGDEDAALARLDQLLEAHPSRLRARAERALSLYRLHRMSECILEVDRLLAEELPDNVRGNLLALRTEARTRLTSRSAARFALRIAAGHDDNVSGFADYDTRFGSGGPALGSAGTSLGSIGGSPDSFIETGGRLRLRGQGFGRLHGRADIDVSLRRHEHLRDFDLDDLRLRGGAEWRVTPHLGVSLTPALRHIRRGGRGLLSDGTLELAAAVSRDPMGLRLGLERTIRRYDSSEFRGLEAEHWALTLRSQWLFGTRSWLATDLEYRDEKARNPAQDRDLERVGISLGRSWARHELSLAAEGNWYRYRRVSDPLQVLRVFDPGETSPSLVATQATALRYRSAEARYRLNFSERWSVQLRLRRLLADIGGGPRYDRTSFDIGLEWNR